MLDDRPGLIGRILAHRHRPQRVEAAVRRWVAIEQDLLSSLAWLHVEQGVQSFERLARGENRAVEPVGIAFALAEIASHLGLECPRQVAEEAELIDQPLSGRLVSEDAGLAAAARPPAEQTEGGAAALNLLARLDRCLVGELAALAAAVDEVDHAQDFVRRQTAEHGQSDVAVTFEVAQDQRHDKHLAVVAYVAVVVVPRGQTHVEQGVLIRHLAVDRPNLAQFAVGRRQQRVEDTESQILFLSRHGPNSRSSEKRRTRTSRTSVKKQSALPLSYAPTWRGRKDSNLRPLP